jgi:hypothetical protein
LVKKDKNFTVSKLYIKKRLIVGEEAVLGNVRVNLYDGMCGTQNARSDWTLNRYGSVNEQNISHFYWELPYPATVFTSCYFSI